MRIVRNNNDHNDDDPDDNRNNDPKVLGEILADEVADFLAAAAGRAPFLGGGSARTESTSDEPVLQLVKSADTPGSVPKPLAAQSNARMRMWRAGLIGSATVTALAVIAGWGEPASVGIPLVVYGAAWIAYLWWNAALRPPLRQACAAAWTVLSRTAAATARTAAAIVRTVLGRVDAARTRHENARTATT